jgi:hypothetical protein
MGRAAVTTKAHLQGVSSFRVTPLLWPEGSEYAFEENVPFLYPFVIIISQTTF